MQATRAWIRALQAVKPIEADGTALLAGMIDSLAERFGDRVALADEDTQLSFRELAAVSDRIARAAAGLQLREAVVGLLMPNCVHYVASWLGLTRAGVTVALINTNLSGAQLVHALRTANVGYLLVSDEFAPKWSAVAEALPGLQVWLAGTGSPGGQFDTIVQPYSDQPLPDAELAMPRPSDRALLIFTSGTTGLSKAANISHRRIAEWSHWFAGLMDAGQDDRLYNCLPLYHSTGGIVAIGSMLVRGASVFIARRFSASRIWTEIAENDCTILQYIGELGRLLALSPPREQETQHRLRLACGNGLQSDVWPILQDRFRIPHILEFYAATEGCVSLYNCEGKPGSIGRIPAFLAHRFPIALIECDVETCEPIRNAEGLCTPCKPQEPGELVARLGASSAIFDGYTDADASAGKILHDVFSTGDRWFRTGDLMRKDEAGFLYFIDRLGDTFRWKGENVSTTEVAMVLRAAPGVTDAIVYGVPLPPHEGKAGMAGVTTSHDFDAQTFREYFAARLPVYAQPLFIRLCNDLQLTGTYKLTKTSFTADGLSETNDTVLFNDHSRKRLTVCDANLLASIKAGSRF